MYVFIYIYSHLLFTVDDSLSLSLNTCTRYTYYVVGYWNSCACTSMQVHIICMSLVESCRFVLKHVKSFKIQVALASFSAGCDYCGDAGANHRLQS